MLIQFQYGTENGDHSEAKAHFFIWNGAKELQIGIASQNDEFDVKLQAGQYAKHPALKGMPAEIGGHVVTASYHLSEGTLFKLHASVKPMQGFPKVASAMFRVREKGPLTKIVLPLLNTPQSVFSQLVTQGRFERISLDEAKAFGYRGISSFEKFFNEDAIEDTFDFEILDEGVAAPKVTVEEYKDTKTGEVVIRKKEVVNRRIIVRRSST
jgi:hypothetical protein